MIKFTQQQEDAVWNSRKAYNEKVRKDGEFETELAGNSLAIPLDAWRAIDTRATAVARQALVVTSALAATSSRAMDIGVIVNYVPKISDSNEVIVTMDGANTSREDQAVISYDGVPQPIFATNWSFGWRQWATMMRSGGGIDLATAANAQRKVLEKIEDAHINGLSSAVVNGMQVYGLRTYPNRNTGTHGLTLNTATGAEWVALVNTIGQALLADNYGDPLTIFVNTGVDRYLDGTDYAANYSQTIRQRLLSMGIVAKIVGSYKIPANEIIAIAGLDTGDWGQVNTAMPLTSRPLFRADPESPYRFHAMASVVPQFRSDFGGNCRIAHYS